MSVTLRGRFGISTFLAGFKRRRPRTSTAIQTSQISSSRGQSMCPPLRAGPQRGHTGSRGLVGRWSSKYNWVRRAAEFDAEEDRLWRQSLTFERRRMAQRHAEITVSAQGKLVEWLETVDGKELPPHEAVRLFEVACKVEQTALGNPMKLHIEHSDADLDLEDLTVEEVLDQLRTLYIEIGEVVGNEWYNDPPAG